MRGKHENLVGKRFGKLVVIEDMGKMGGKKFRCKCQCDCGNVSYPATAGLNNGTSQSCGCNQVERAKKGIRTKHNMRRKRQYNIWSKMKDRCLNSKTKLYKHYGGRGITVCDKWLSFEGFWEDMKEGYADNLTLERIDNELGYSKGNCKWATIQEQSQNKRTTHYITVDGERKSVTYFANKYKIDQDVVYYRLKSGWSDEDAVKKPNKNSKAS